MAEAVLVRVVAGLVEVVHVQLSHERGEIVVLEEFWKDLLCEFIRLANYEAVARLVPADNRVILWIL